MKVLQDFEDYSLDLLVEAITQKEIPLIFSDRFRGLINKIDHPITRRLIGSEGNRENHKSSYIDLLGTYNPLEIDESKVILLDEERTLVWLRKGAQPTDKSKNLLKKVKLWEKFMASKNKKLQREEKLTEKLG